ncbi:hypothetical protein BJF92_12650 [Rhizobium rhizosphaerae]|uniref:Uncharacterized protein n=1 Tax=Xaviernesmea rhizosphaerae TaxID=1672749 RepID=A0A1Q9AJV5_9HYPH|nr:hypothetical protein [Xaviernesmea rhizosphaerae]OLP55521.1 hypothetical protein BJF92_12650 [Xaviernesmea rhizosphaerae]OQP85397.1 hypothetical protein BTR14_16010 [Xaviernesmea rhizosphaerae]
MSFLADMTLEQQEITMIISALSRWCSDAAIDVDSEPGRDAATVFLGLYKSGHTSCEALLSAMQRVNGQA